MTRGGFSRDMVDLHNEIENLIHPNPELAKQAEEKLIAMGTDAVNSLTEALSSKSDRHRWKIISVLTKIGDARATPALIACLNNSNGAIRAAAAQCLGMIGDKRAVIPLIESLQRTFGQGSQMWTIQALGMLGDKRAVAPLIQVMNETNSSVERYTAIEALGRIGDPRASGALRVYADDESHHVRSRVEIALALLNGAPQKSG